MLLIPMFSDKLFLVKRNLTPLNRINMRIRANKILMVDGLGMDTVLAYLMITN